MKEYLKSEVRTIDLSDDIMVQKILKIKLALDKFINLNEKISEKVIYEKQVKSNH